MRSSVSLIAAILTMALLVVAAASGAAGQTLDNPGFHAQPRPINYATPLCAPGGTRAVIVYGKSAVWTQAAAAKVQKAIESWSGQKLEILDDRAVTSDETWLLTDAYRRTPMIVLGNAQDNRLVHALATRYLAQSNHAWPGGDRYVLRTLFEPFAADVNWIVMETSTEAGMTAAIARLEEMLKTLPKDAAATIPHTRINGGVKDKWATEARWWKPPAEFAGQENKSAAELAAIYKGPAITAGDSLSKAGASGELGFWAHGGIAGRASDPGIIALSPQDLRVLAAMHLLAGRAAGNRTHLPWDHYGGMSFVVAARALLQSGVLTAQEVNEFENFFTLAGAYPNEYFYDHIGAGDGWVNEVSGRHTCGCFMITSNTLDYVANHCRMDEKTSKEINRRLTGMRVSLRAFANSFRDNWDTAEMGESTMMIFYTMLHQGMLDWITNGNLRHAADMYVASSDNAIVPNQWRIPMCYAGLDSYIGAGPGAMFMYFHGRSLVTAAAFYYDDPQYRWFIPQSREIGGPFGSVACSPMYMHWDSAGLVTDPKRFFGVMAVPYDKRLYDLGLNRNTTNRWAFRNVGLPPGPYEKSADRVAFRDGMDPNDAYLFLATSQNDEGPYQNNSLARYTDLGEVWLYHNTMKTSSFARNKVTISNGKTFRPRNGTTIEGLSNFGEFSAVSSKESDVAGAHHTRTVVHSKGHWFAVLDRVEAADDSQFNLVCRWRTPQPCGLRGNVWVADAPSGSAMHIQNTEPLLQTSEIWEADGNVLSQYAAAKLAKGEAHTLQNLLYVSGLKRPDEFQAKRLSDSAMLIKGKTAAGEQLALVATGEIKVGQYTFNADIITIDGNKIYLTGSSSSSGKSNLLVDTANGKTLVYSSSWTPSDQPPQAAQGVQVSGPIAPELAKLWAQTPETPTSHKAPAAEDKLIQVIPADQPLQRPLRQLRGFAVTSNVPSWQPISQLTDGQYGGALAGNTPTWGSSDNLEITLTFREPTDISFLRLVGILKMVPAYGFGCEGFGTKHYQEGDFKFSVVLSDDGFQKDIRKIDNPKVTWEETPFYPTMHSGLGRLPTWRIASEGKAKQVKLLPRATTKERAGLYVVELEAYSPQMADDLTATAFAADVDGDGAAELLVGSSNKELALYRPDGKRTWNKLYADKIFTMGCADLDASGKFQALAYTANEILHRVNGDGSERAPADLSAASLKYDKRDSMGGILAMGAWQPGRTPGKRGSAETGEVICWSEACFRVAPSGETIMGKIPMCRGAARIVNLLPGEPEVLASVGWNIQLWSTRRDANGDYICLATKPMAGSSSAPFMRGFGWGQGIDLPAAASRGPLKGIIAAHEGGLNWFPVADFAPGAKDTGWSFSTGGAPVTAALVDETAADGPRVLIAREDGFVNVFNLADGKLIGLINAEGPVLGMALIGQKGAPRRLAVGTKFGLRVFDGSLQKIGGYELPSVAFAGPGGPASDRVYAVSAGGKVTVLVIK